MENVSICLGGQQLVAISHHVAPGEILSVMGPSGSGKSTLLAFLGGFLDPVFQASGKVMLDGDDLLALATEDRHAGILFQDPLLFPHMSVAGNLLFAIPASVRSRGERRSIVRAALADVGLEGLEERDPDTLSGGQRVRVALARVLVSAPRMLLLDEPFSRLDSELRQQIRALVFIRARTHGLATVLVTHDEEDAVAAAGPVIRVGEAAR